VGGFPYGVGTPLPVDWSQFPTQAPYPTFPPFPTAIYGLGTPVPITGSVSITGSVRIDDATPVRVEIVTTPTNTPTPFPTMPSLEQLVAGISVSTPTSGQRLPPVYNDPSQVSPMVFTVGGLPGSNPVRVQICEELMDTQFSFPYTFIPILNVKMHYLYLCEFVYGGIDMLRPTLGFATVWFLVILVRRVYQPYGGGGR
jgi:hypothetical protein